MEEEKEHERWNPKDLELCLSQVFTGLPRWLSGKESAHQCRRCNRRRFHPRVGKIPWRRKWQPTPVFLSWKSHGQRNLVGYSPWGCKESDTPERLSMAQTGISTHFPCCPGFQHGSAWHCQILSLFKSSIFAHHGFFFLLILLLN